MRRGFVPTTSTSTVKRRYFGGLNLRSESVNTFKEFHRVQTMARNVLFILSK